MLATGRNVSDTPRVPFVLPRAVPIAPGWPPDVAPNAVILSSHINLIRDSPALWPGDVDAQGHWLRNVKLENVTGVLVDPTTTAGDLIARGALAAPERLPVGAAGQVLTVDLALPQKLKWSAPIAAVPSVFGRTGAVVAVAGDYSAAMVTNAVSDQGAYANPAWITSLAYSKITGAPAAGVGSVFGRSGAVVAQTNDYSAAQVTNAVSDLGTYANPSWIANLAWNKLTGVPVSFPPAAHIHDAADVVSGRFTTARLGAGVADSTVYLRGDGAWAAVAGSGGGSVTSVFGRAGTVIAQTGDYSVSQVTGALADVTAAKGDILARTAAAVARLPVGADGQVLQADSVSAAGVKWAAVSGSWVDPTSAKGDLLVRDAAAITRLPVGTNGWVLTADTSTATGIKWAAAPGGGGGVSSIFTRTGAVVAQAGDYNVSQVLNAVSDLGAYVNPSWISSLSFAKITGVPAFITDPTTTKGDLIARGASAVVRLPVGADGMVLTSDAAQLLGVKWAPSAAGMNQTPWLSDINAANHMLYSVSSLGIGTASPVRKLQVAGVAAGGGLAVTGSGPCFQLSNADSEPNGNTQTCGFALATAGGHFGLPNAGDWIIFSQGTARGDIYISANYQGAGANRNVLLQSAGGNVGIGTANPHFKLEVFDAAATQVDAIFGNASGSVALLSYNNVGAIQAYNGTAATGGANLILQPNFGNIGIGITPQTVLHVKGSSDANFGILKLEALTNNVGIALFCSGAAGMLNWQISNNYSSAGGLSFLRSTTPNGNPTTPAVEFDAAGRVGIAKSNPGYALDVTGDVNCTGAFRVNGAVLGGAQTPWTTNVDQAGHSLVSVDGIVRIGPGQMVLQSTQGEIADAQVTNGCLHFFTSGQSTLFVKFRDASTGLIVRKVVNLI